MQVKAFQPIGVRHLADHLSVKKGFGVENDESLDPFASGFNVCPYVALSGMALCKALPVPICVYYF
jgi:hypothetical protein